MRNHLVHGYDRIEVTIVWEVVGTFAIPLLHFTGSKRHTGGYASAGPSCSAARIDGSGRARLLPSRSWRKA